MQDINNIESAIQYFYKDFENIQIGSLLPFTMAYNATTQIDFNTLCFDAEVKHIFYGNVTFSMDSNDALDTTTRIAITAFKTLNGVNRVPFMDIHKFFPATPLNAQSVQGTTQGIFAQEIVLQENSIVAFDGFLVAITNKP